MLVSPKNINISRLKQQKHFTETIKTTNLVLNENLTGLFWLKKVLKLLHLRIELKIITFKNRIKTDLIIQYSKLYTIL